MIDLRSDTVTKPTDEMRAAMATAEVGDDVYGEDPTVAALERRAADLLGKEAAIFVPSGTMGNQIAVALHTKRGNEVICEERAHVFVYEMGAMAALSGVMPRTVAGRDGARLAWEDVRAAIRPQTTTHSGTGLVALENTHNLAGGTVLPLETAREICDGAHEHGLPVHLDGARVFNAAAALGVPVAEVVEPFDSVMFCLSKGLGAPIGSVLVGERGFVERAWIVRKMFGGGMRQVGVIAAAGIVALEKMTSRLADDHANARALASGVAALPRVAAEPEAVQTNIVVFDLEAGAPDADELSARLKARGVLANPIGPRRMRMVTHCDVSRDDCLTAVEATREALDS
jgi:threonine aldolase